LPSKIGVVFMRTARVCWVGEGVLHQPSDSRIEIETRSHRRAIDV
jgi:hypothetical protein